jgi:hypothetical protein
MQPDNSRRRWIDTAGQLNSMLARFIRLITNILVSSKGAYMKTKLAMMAVILVVVSEAGFSQQPQKAQEQWEYLVVSYGKTLFSHPAKTTDYFPLTHHIASEAVDLQGSLDGLGSLGWELVSIVGAIGGDQQLVLKRKYEPTRSKADSLAIEKQRDKLIAEYSIRAKKEADEKLRLEKLVATKKAPIDLDAVDSNGSYEKARADAVSYINDLSTSINSDNIISRTVAYDNGLGYTVAYQFDLSRDFLKNVNEYRKSEIDQYLSDALDQVTVDVDKLSIYEVTILLEAYLSIDGKKYKVSDLSKKWSYLKELNAE